MLVALQTVGCGGDGGQAPAPNCLQVQPCGGDVVGTWSFLGACSNIPARNEELQQSCPGRSLNSLSVALTGSLTFNADGTYTATNWHEAFGGTEVVPLTCANTATCAENNETTTSSTNGTTVNLTTTCTGTSTCVCRTSGTVDVTTGSGTFAAGSAVLSLTGSPSTSTFSYCVEDDRLHLMQTLTEVTTNPVSERTIILSDIVAQRL